MPVKPSHSMRLLPSLELDPELTQFPRIPMINEALLNQIPNIEMGMMGMGVEMQYMTNDAIQDSIPIPIPHLHM